MNDLDYIIMDWCQYSLNDFVANEKVLSNVINLSKMEIISQVLCGLQHLHKYNISKLLIFNFTILFLFSAQKYSTSKYFIS